MTKIDEHRAKLETLAKTHPWIREVVKEHDASQATPERGQEGDQCDTREKLEADVRKWCGSYAYQADMVWAWLNRQAAITERELEDTFLDRADEVITRRELVQRELQAKVDELTAERDELQREVDNMLAELDSCEAVDEVNSELAAERDALQAQVRQLQEDLKGARKSSDSWYEVAMRQGGKLVKLRKQLKAERELARMWPRFSDGTPVRVGDSMMYDERAERVQGIRFYRNAVVFEFDDGCHCRITHGFAIGQPVDHPNLKAADGQPIAIGQTLYGGDGQAWEVRNVKHGEKYPVYACGADEENTYDLRQLKPEWLTHEKPDSWERIVDELRGYPPCFEMSRDAVGALADRIEKLTKEEER